MATELPARVPEFEDEISLLEILNVLLKRWRAVVGMQVWRSRLRAHRAA